MIFIKLIIQFQNHQGRVVRAIMRTGLKRRKSVKIKKQFLESVANLKGCTSENILKITFGACLFDREDILRTLLYDYDVDVDAVDENGETALFSAVRGRSLDCVDLLLENNANIHHKNNNGENIIWLAVTMRNFNMVDKFMFKTSPGQETLDDVLAKLINRRDAVGLSLLAEYGNINLENFSDKLHFRDKTGHTPLQHAIYKCAGNSVKKIIMAGVKISYIKENLDWSTLFHQLSFNYNTVMYPLIAGCPLDDLFTKVDFNWCYIDSKSQDMKIGNGIRTLLEIIKEPVDNTQTRYLICQKFEDQEIELIHYVKFIPFTRVFIFDSVLDFLPSFSGLKWLSLNNSIMLKNIDISNFTSLKFLTLVSMNLQTVPESVKDLKNLRYLNISYNKQLSEIPLWISKLQLTHLLMNDNSLTDIPSVLNSNLKVLKLHNNKIHVLNASISTLKNLIHITLYGNPLTFPDIPSVLNDVRLLKKYLAEYLADTIPTPFTKVAVIGKERAGKSSLAQALMASKGKVENDVELLKTDGLDIFDVALEKEFNIKLFDLAGDIDYFESHAILLTDDTIYLAVFDLRSYALPFTKHDYFSRIESWLSVIHAQTKNSRVILVGTHADTHAVTKDILENIWNNIRSVLLQNRCLHQEKYQNDFCDKCLLCVNTPLTRKLIGEHFGLVEAVKSELLVKEINDDPPSLCNNKNQCCFPHITGYLEVSSVKSIPRKILSSNNISISNLKECIKVCCTDINKYRQNIPRKWSYIHTAISEKAKEINFPILVYGELKRDFTRHLSITDEDFDFYLQYYHSKGDILYFPKEKHGKGIIITDPKWLSLKLCTVLSYRELPQIVNGVVKHESLRSLWKDIPEMYISFLIEIFRKVNIFIPLDISSELIPTRLPIGRPDSNQWPLTTSENELSFLYHFDFLPPFLFLYIMAEISQDLSNKKRMKMKPVYLGNCIVFLMDDPGIPCHYHAPIVKQTNVDQDYMGLYHDYSKGLTISDITNLRNAKDYLNLNRNSVIVSTNDSDIYDSVDVSYVDTTIHRVKFEVFPHLNSIQINIRGPKPCCILPNACGFIATSVTKVNTDVNQRSYLLCPACVKTLNKNPGKFSLDEIDNVLPVCSAGHNLESWELVLTGKCKVEHSLTVSQITKAITEFESPKLFVLLPVNLQGVDFTEFLTLTYFKEGYAVHLLCEAPNSWHFLNEPGYRVSRPKKFVRTYGKRLQALINVLLYFETPAKIASSLFEPLEGVADGFSSLRNMAETLENHLINFSDEWNFLKEESLESQIEFLESNDGLHRRKLCRFLNKNDEEKRFGDLIPCFIHERVYWLCSKHCKQYSQANIQISA